MKKIIGRLVILIGIMMPIIGWSHPGHGAYQGSPIHYFTSWAHSLSILALAAISWAAYSLVKFIVDGKRPFEKS